ncbi:MAG: asparagine synthase-related protein, partial [Acidimicrobiia bacterium]
VEASLRPEVRSDFNSGVESMLTGWNRHVKDASHLSEFDRLLWLESQTRLVDFSNHAHDRNSMALSIEARLPFQDHELWEYSMGLPRRLKVDGYGDARVEKLLLREAVTGLLPEPTRNRRKQGLTGPHERWLRQPRLGDWAEELLSPRALGDVGVFIPQVVADMRSEHQKGAPNRGRLLLGILCVQTWVNEFVQAGNG